MGLGVIRIDTTLGSFSVDVDVKRYHAVIVLHLLHDVLNPQESNKGPKYGGNLPPGSAEAAEGTPRKKPSIDPVQFAQTHTNAYRLVGVPVDFKHPFEADLVKKMYRKISRQTHPDKMGSEFKNLFQDIAKAYEMLTEPQRRERYDEGEDLNDLATQHKVESEDGKPPPPIKEEIEKM